MAEKTTRRKEFEDKIPEEVRQHVRAAREELRESVKAFLPPEFMEHRKKARKEMLLAFRDVVQRAEMFAHHHVQRERLSVRVRMSDILSTLERASFVEFVNLFKPEEGRMGVTVTFVAILELVREGLIEIVQTEAYAPIHVRKGEGSRGLRLAVDNDAIAGDAPVPEHMDVSPTTEADGETDE